MKTKIVLLSMLSLLLAGCRTLTPPKGSETVKLTDDKVAGLYQMHNVARLMTVPGFTNVARVEPQWVEEAFRTINRLEFLVELQPLR